jgi:hypothetical protein
MDQNPVIRNLHKRQGAEERGNVLIRGLCWQQGTDAIIDVRITDLDTKSNISRAPMKVLAAHEREKKKRKYLLEPCLEQRRHFSPFVVHRRSHWHRSADYAEEEALRQTC